MKIYRGFGLLEVLITLVIVGIGIAGLAGLTQRFVLASENARQYEIALRLASSRLDRMATFNTTEQYQALTSGSESVPNTELPSNAGTTFQRSWVVTDNYFNGVSWGNTPPSGYSYSYPGRKQITMTVQWQNSSGESRAVTLNRDLVPVFAISSEELYGNLDPNNRPAPKVPYTPGMAPNVISIDLGNGSKQETSKPLPTVDAKTPLTKEVAFETVTYKPDNTGAYQQIEQHLVSVSCSCSFASTASAYLPAQTSYSSQGLYWSIGAMVNKQTGGLNSSDKDQPALCNSCCANHFDGSSSAFTDYYAPLVTSRKHYDSNLAVANAGNYLDACRFVRLDGYYRPLPDWNLVKTIVVSTDFMNKAANQQSYRNYVSYVVEQYINWQKGTLNWTNTTGDIAPTITDFDAWLPSHYATGGDTTTTVTTTTGTMQLMVRGIYIDLLNPTYLAAIDTSQSDFMKRVPFQDLNLTMLAEWSLAPLPNDLSGVTSDYAVITNEPIKTITDLDNYYLGSYSRGFLTAKKATVNNGQQQRAIGIRGTVYQGNSGVTGSLISARDQTKAIMMELPIQIQGTTALSVTGRISCLKKTKNNDPTAIACDANDFFSGSSGLVISTSTANATCSLSLPTANNQPAFYTCSAPANSVLTINLSNTKNNNFYLKPATIMVTMTPPADGNVINGPCSLLIESGVTNEANLVCTP